MWEIEIGQSYYDTEDVWCGQGYPVQLESKFGDTKAILAEIQDFLKENDDNEPLTANPDEIEKLWDEARKDPRDSYDLILRKNDHEEDDFKGTVAIVLNVAYNIEEARKRQTPKPEPEPEPEQLNLFG